MVTLPQSGLNSYPSHSIENIKPQCCDNCSYRLFYWICDRVGKQQVKQQVQSEMQEIAQMTRSSKKNIILFFSTLEKRLGSDNFMKVLAVSRRLQRRAEHGTRQASIYGFSLSLVLFN